MPSACCATTPLRDKGAENLREELVTYLRDTGGRRLRASQTLDPTAGLWLSC